jgi:hypothetical protein
MSARGTSIAGLLLCLAAAAAHGKTLHPAPSNAAQASSKSKAAAPASASSASEASAATVASSGTEGEAKEVSGMSIVGNSETPKSLTIIPWKSSEIGRDADFKSTLLSQDIVPIDKPTFLRGLDFYKSSTRP